MCYNDLGDTQKALDFYNKAYDIENKILPSDHPSIATSLNNIGLCYKSLGDTQKALDFLNKAYYIKKKIYPSDHPSIDPTAENAQQLLKILIRFNFVYYMFNLISGDNYPHMPWSLFSLIGSLNQFKLVKLVLLV